MISVIINTKDRLKDLINCVKSILKQRCKISELIIVDAGLNYEKTEKEIVQLLDKNEIVLKFFHSLPGNSYQRNLGIKHINEKSKYVCFFDDDVILFKDTIENFMKKFKEYAQVDAVQGIEYNRVCQHPLGRLVRKVFFIGYEDKHWKLLPSGEHVMVIKPDKDEFIGSFMTGFTCVKKEIVEEFRFDEWFKNYAFLEDYDFSYRIGKKHQMIISPEVKFIHNQKTPSRLNTFKRSEMFIVNKSYFFLKNIKKTLFRRIAYIWSLFGHLVLNFGKSIYRGDRGYFLGTFRGVMRLFYGGGR